MREYLYCSPKKSGWTSPQLRTKATDALRVAQPDDQERWELDLSAHAYQVFLIASSMLPLSINSSLI